MAIIISKGHSLAESPGLNSYSGDYFWVDIDSSELHICPPGGTVRSLDFSRLGATSAHAVGKSSYLLTGRKCIYLFTGDSEKVLWTSENEGKWRLNDSYLDLDGTLVVGTKDLSNSGRHSARLGVFDGKSFFWLPLRLGLANGIAIDRRRSIVYVSDSSERKIYKLGFDSPDVIDWHTLSVQVFTQGLEGQPDGLKLDEEGNVWVALWGAGKIKVLTPEARPLKELNLGTTDVSSLAWANNLKTEMLVTTAASGKKRLGFPIIEGGDVILVRAQDFSEVPHS